PNTVPPTPSSAGSVASNTGKEPPVRTPAALVPGKLHGSARITGGALDLTRGGHVTFPHREDFDLAQPLTVECWVRLERPGQCSVIASCGLWQHTGWFLQQLGGTWRWHVGGIDCDGGKVTPGQWTHLAATFDGRVCRVFQDGVQVAEKAGTPNTTPWPGDLHIGQYSPGPAPQFQVTGQIAGLKIYHRALSAGETADAARAKPQAAGK
ncbi:MAG: LamG domain-containing protein, partial [Tepidisphaerales bacterium]